MEWMCRQRQGTTMIKSGNKWDKQKQVLIESREDVIEVVYEEMALAKEM